jgi:hypothetical protein
VAYVLHGYPLLAEARAFPARISRCPASRSRTRCTSSRARYALNQFQHPNGSAYRLHCAAGRVRIELHAQRCGVFRAGDAGWIWRDAPVADRDARSIAQAHALLDQVEGRAARLCSLIAGVRSRAENSRRVDLAEIRACLSPRKAAPAASSPTSVKGHTHGHENQSRRSARD